MARPKKDPDELLSERVHFWTTPQTRDNLANKSQAVGLSEAEFLRRLIDDTPLPSHGKIDPALIAELNNHNVQLSAIGNNVNQLSLATHTGRAFQKFWRDIGLDVKRDLKKGRALLNRLLKEV